MVLVQQQRHGHARAFLSDENDLRSYLCADLYVPLDECGLDLVHRHEGFERTSNCCAELKVNRRPAKLPPPVDFMARVGSLSSFHFAGPHAEGAFFGC